MASGISIADAVQTGIGLATSVAGLINAGKTKREAQRIAESRPNYEISPLVGQDLALAKSELGNGMGSAAENAYNDLNNGQFSSSLSAILKSGGNLNSIGDIYGNSQEGRLRLAQMKDNLRLNQIQNVVRASQRMQDEQQTQWQVNKFAPWQDKAQANAAARQGAQQQINQGLNTLGAGIMNGANAIQENANLNLPVYGLNNGFDNGGFAAGIPTGGTSAPPIKNTNVLSPMTFPTYGG